MNFMLDHWRGILFSTIAAIALHFSYVAGQSSIQSKWDAVKASQAQKQAELSEKYRAQENEAQKQAERIDRDTASKQTIAASSASSSRSAAIGLRSDTQAIDTRNQTATSPDIASIIGQASTARNLLATCADRYSSVAAVADELTIQVTGLQDFIATAIPDSQ